MIRERGVLKPASVIAPFTLQGWADEQFQILYSLPLIPISVPA
jgi:hypothetical protein